MFYWTSGFWVENCTCLIGNHFRERILLFFEARLKELSWRYHWPEGIFFPQRAENHRKWLQCLKSFYFLCEWYLCSWDEPFQLAPTQTSWEQRLESCMVKIIIVKIAFSVKTSKFLRKPWFLATFTFFTWVTDLPFINSPSRISSVLCRNFFNFFSCLLGGGRVLERSIQGACEVSLWQTIPILPISFHLEENITGLTKLIEMCSPPTPATSFVYLVHTSLQG